LILNKDHAGRHAEAVGAFPAVSAFCIRIAVALAPAWALPIRRILMGHYAR